jgi:uncharacterized membrane protein YjjB (DUF3815 family)
MISWTATFRSYQLLLGIVIVVGYFVVLSFMVLHDVAGKDILIGGLAAAFGAVVGYFYGSSSSSDRKTEILAQNQAPKAPVQ